MEYYLIIALVIIIYMSVKLGKLEGRMKSIQYTLDQLTKQLRLPENPIDDELRELIKGGESVKAVKKARETLGLSLLEGKNYIDKLKSNVDNG